MRTTLAIAVFAAIPATASLAQPAAPDVRKEIIQQLESAGSKFVRLAEAVPEDKFAWRPAEGIRSFSEIFTHVASGNYFITTLAGVKPPEGIERGMEKTMTEKGKILEVLKGSFDHLKKAVEGLTDEDLLKEVQMYRQQTTVRNVFLTTASHDHEHLGQAIAYARMNGIVPPWSRKD